MQATLIVALVLHVLSGVFWAGSTFVLSRTGGHQADQFFRPQMGAATGAVLTGALLWFLLHRDSAGIQEYILGVGAACAVLAAGVQGASAPAVRARSLRRSEGVRTKPSPRVQSAHRGGVAGDHCRVHGGRSLRLNRTAREHVGREATAAVRPR